MLRRIKKKQSEAVEGSQTLSRIVLGVCAGGPADGRKFGVSRNVVEIKVEVPGVVCDGLPTWALVRYVYRGRLTGSTWKIKHLDGTRALVPERIYEWDPEE